MRKDKDPKTEFGLVHIAATAFVAVISALALLIKHLIELIQHNNL